jgi:hypothetical protein
MAKGKKVEKEDEGNGETGMISGLGFNAADKLFGFATGSGKKKEK